MSTTTDISVLKLNYLTQAQYDEALSNNLIHADEVYLTPAELAGVLRSTDDENGNVTLSYSTDTIDHLLMNQLTIQDSNDIDFFVVNPTGNDLLLAIDTTAASGTIDGDIYANLVALGWDSEVIE